MLISGSQTKVTVDNLKEGTLCHALNDFPCISQYCSFRAYNSSVLSYADECGSRLLSLLSTPSHTEVLTADCIKHTQILEPHIFWTSSALEVAV